MLPCTQRISDLKWKPKGAYGHLSILWLAYIRGTGIILSGSPYSVYASDAPHVDPAVFDCGVPVLGICYGLQEIARTYGGNVEAHTHREYGYARIKVEKTGKGDADRLFEGIQMEEDGALQVSLDLSLKGEADVG